MWNIKKPNILLNLKTTIKHVKFPVEYVAVQSSVVFLINSSWGNCRGSTTRGISSGGYHSNIRSSVVWDTETIEEVKH